MDPKNWMDLRMMSKIGSQQEAVEEFLSHDQHTYTNMAKKHQVDRRSAPTRILDQTP